MRARGGGLVPGTGAALARRRGRHRAVPARARYSGAGQPPVISAAILGDPMPVDMSKPGVVG
jgi:hypothetical protein